MTRWSDTSWSYDLWMGNLWVLITHEKLDRKSSLEFVENLKLLPRNCLKIPKQVSLRKCHKISPNQVLAPARSKGLWLEQPQNKQLLQVVWKSMLLNRKPSVQSDSRRQKGSTLNFSRMVYRQQLRVNCWRDHIVGRKLDLYIVKSLIGPWVTLLVTQR